MADAASGLERSLETTQYSPAISGDRLPADRAARSGLRAIEPEDGPHSDLESLLKLGLHRVIARIPDIVAEKCHVREARKGLQKLRLGGFDLADRGGCRYLTEVRVRDFRQQGCSCRQLFRCELVDVQIRISQVCSFGAYVCNLESQIRRDLPLQGKVPLLNIAGTQIVVDSEYTLSQPGVRS